MFFRYKLHEATAAMPAKPTTPSWSSQATIITGACRRLHVLAVVPVEEEDSPYVGLLLIEPIE